MYLLSPLAFILILLLLFCGRKKKEDEQNAKKTEEMQKEIDELKAKQNKEDNE